MLTDSAPKYKRPNYQSAYGTAHMNGDDGGELHIQVSSISNFKMSELLFSVVLFGVLNMYKCALWVIDARQTCDTQYAGLWTMRDKGRIYF